MVSVAVVTDSVASIPESLLESLNIEVVAYYIHRKQEVLRDLVNIQRDEFLKWLDTASILPTTANPGPGDYLEHYERLARQGFRQIISLHITSRGSGAYQAARSAQDLARETLPGVQIEVIDTENVALCQGWMVIEAARAALAGKGLNDIVALVKRMIPVTHMIQTADTLKYLYMGGRIGRAKHLVGSMLKIKPLIGIADGVVTPLGVARSRARAYQMMVDMVEATVGKMGRIKVAYLHAGALQEVEKLRGLVEKRLNCVETLVAELSPALAVHTGRGTAGLCYYPVDSV